MSIPSTQETKRPVVQVAIVSQNNQGSAIAKAVSDAFVNSDSSYDLEVQNATATNDVSDGYHTFGELYEHRQALFFALLSTYANDAWMSALHHDGSQIDGWFIAGIQLAQDDLDSESDISSRQITYHAPMSAWAELQQLGVQVLEHAPDWDGHTSDDVIARLKSFAKVVSTWHAEDESDDDITATTIYTDHNGLTVVSFAGEDERVEGRDMVGHVYNVGPTTDGYQLVQFQQGPVPANGVNGVTNETLLAILIDRTTKLNEQFACPENEVAIEHMKAALRSLEDRTNKRLQRGVEGKEVV